MQSDIETEVILLDLDDYPPLQEPSYGLVNLVGSNPHRVEVGH